MEYETDALSYVEKKEIGGATCLELTPNHAETEAIFRHRILTVATTNIDRLTITTSDMDFITQGFTWDHDSLTLYFDSFRS